MRTSSSRHTLNADNKLSKSGKMLWILQNLFNNYYYPYKISDLCIKNFCPEIEKTDWDKIHIKSSPSRSLSDMFWMKMDWKTIKSELGSINIFDTGAGTGGYALKINDFAKGITSYCGVDLFAYEEWEHLTQEYDFITMKQFKSEHILDAIPNETNLFMSQSAIEHFKKDLLYFDQIRKFIEKTNNNTIQIHLFPSAACLRLFLWHGIRQYTPRTISTIVQLFKSHNTYSILFRLGGRNCNDLHYQFITYPYVLSKKKDWRNTKTDEYRERLKSAIKIDIEHNNHRPNFYALLIHSNFKKPIFKEMERLSIGSCNGKYKAIRHQSCCNLQSGIGRRSRSSGHCTGSERSD